MGWDDVFFIAGGAYTGWRKRQNDKMYAQGIRPSFAQRHPLLLFMIGFLVTVPLIGVTLVFIVPNYLDWVTEADKNLGNTGIIDLLGFTAWLWVPGIIAGVRSELRKPHPTTIVTVQRPALPAPPRPHIHRWAKVCLVIAIICSGTVVIGALISS